MYRKPGLVTEMHNWCTRYLQRSYILGYFDLKLAIISVLSYITF